MRKNLLYCIGILFLAACSPRNNGFTNRNSQKFKSYYNTLFNSKEAMETEINSRKKSFIEDYYEGYIPIITYEDTSLINNPLGNEISEASENNLHLSGGTAEIASNTKPTSILEISEAKAIKAIDNHSMLFNGEEKNPYMLDAYLLLAKARIYQQKYLEAIDCLQTAKSRFQNNKRLPLIMIYEAMAYTQLKDYYRANELFLELRKNPLKKKYQALLSIYYSEMLLKSGQKENAVKELSTAYDLNKDQNLRSRIAYLRGQILTTLHKNEEARASFATAFKNTKNFEMEVKSQIEIAKLMEGETSEYKTAKQNLIQLSKKGTYQSRKNEMYYALGKLAQNFHKKEEAIDFFKQSIKEKISDGQIRGLAYYELGKNNFDQDDYILAGNYYDSALVAMKHLPTKKKLTKLNDDIKKLTKNYYLIKKNDSLLALIHLPENEKIKFFENLIAEKKKKEAIEDAKLNKEKRNKGFDTGDYNSKNAGSFTIAMDDANIGKGKFYFANQSNVAKGQADFKKTWGSRSLVDNWRYQNKDNSLQNQKDLAMGRSSIPDPRRFETAFYLEQLPKDPKEIETLKLARDTASLGLGIMYHQLFDNTKLASKTLFQLVENRPIADIKQQALYQIFYMNYEGDQLAANQAKTIILEEFPYSQYAEFVRNPKKSKEKKTNNIEAEKLYLQAYQLYKEANYNESKILLQNTIKQYPSDAMVPKMSLLDAYNSAKTAGKEVMILQLEQIVLNYPKTEEGIKAKSILKNIKSDLATELSDDKGNIISSSTNNTSNQSEMELIKERQLKEEAEKDQKIKDENKKKTNILEDEGNQGPNMFQNSTPPPPKPPVKVP